MGLKAVVRYATVALLVATAGAAWADPKEAHKLGVEAIEAGRWADAERFFRAALTERSEEKFNRLLKTAYLPHYYLGVALSELGQCQAAIDSWATSEKQGQIQKSRFAGDLSSRRQRCRAHLQQVSAARSEVEQLLDRVGAASSSLASLSRTPELASRWNEDGFGARQQAAEKKLAGARRRFEANAGAGADLDRLDEAKTVAMQALADLDATRADARRRLGELNAAAATALEHLETVEQGARRAVRSVSDLAPYPRRLGSRVAAVQRSLKEIEDNKAGASAGQLQELEEELTAAVGGLRRAARRPPEELALAVEAFLNGSFEQTLDLLEDERLAENRRSKPHVCLLRAASGHALWILGGERDEALRELATTAIADCAGGESDQRPESPSLKYFSPRFVEFHAATLDAIARAAETLEPLEGDGESAAPPAGESPPGEPAAGEPPAAETRSENGP